MNNEEFVEQKGTTIYQFIEDNCETTDALEYLMEYFRRAGRLAIITELAEWVQVHDSIINLEEWK